MGTGTVFKSVGMDEVTCQGKGYSRIEASGNTILEHKGEGMASEEDRGGGTPTASDTTDLLY